MLEDDVVFVLCIIIMSYIDGYGYIFKLVRKEI